MNKLTLALNLSVDSTFMWRTHTQDFLKPQDMATSHLFNTLRMIWNHKMPESAKLRPYVQWNGFSPFYTDKYLTTAIRQLALELSKRQMTANQQKDLQYMINWLSTQQLERNNNASIQ